MCWLLRLQQQGLVTLLRGGCRAGADRVLFNGLRLPIRRWLQPLRTTDLTTTWETQLSLFQHRATSCMGIALSHSEEQNVPPQLLS